MTLHNAGSSAGYNIGLKREGEKRKKKRKRSYYNTGYLYLVTLLVLTPPNTVWGLTLLSRLDVVLSLWYSDSTLNALG